jgi:general secretion pathway protein G
MALGNSWPTAAPLAIATVFLVFGVSWRLRSSIQFLTAMALALGVWVVSAYSLRFSYQNHYNVGAKVATRIEIEAFKTSLQTFEKDCGRLPSSEEGLGALVQKPANVPDSQWHGPYLDSIPKDPWGHGYVYHCPGRHGTNRFEVYSSGPDGVSKSGGEDADDIASWR